MAASCSFSLCASSPATFTSPTASARNAAPKPTSQIVSFRKSELFSTKLTMSAPQLGRVNSRQHLTVCKLAKGDVLPAIGLKDQDGKVVSLDKFKGKNLVIFFYTKDENPSCIKQVSAFRDAHDKFRKAGAEVVGISSDNPQAHKAFKENHRLQYTLLCDEGGKLRKDWGIPMDFAGSIPGRQTYVIDKAGKVQLVFNNQFEPAKHIAETLKCLESLVGDAGQPQLNEAQ